MLKCQNGRWAGLLGVGVMAFAVNAGAAATKKPAAAKPATPAAPSPAPAPTADPGHTLPPVVLPSQADARDVVVALSDLKGVQQVCDAVRLGPAGEGAPARNVLHDRLAFQDATERRRITLENVYTVEIPSDGFRFANYDPETGRLGLDGSRGFYAHRGALGMWSSDTEGLEVTVSAPDARALALAHDAGRIRLRLWLHLDADPDDAEAAGTLNAEPCATRPSTQAWQMAVHWLAGELWDVKDQKRLALFVTDKGRQTPVVAQSLLGATQLRVSVPEGAGEQGGAIQAALEGRKAALDGCYQKHGRHAEGGVGVGLAFGKDGTLSDANVDVATLENEDLEACVLAAVKGGGALRGPAGSRVSVALVWERD